MRSFHTMGDEKPSPGVGVFQRTLVLLLQCVGSPVDVETPVPSEPRKRGQLSSDGATPTSTVASRTAAGTVAMRMVRYASLCAGIPTPPRSQVSASAR